MKYHDEGTKMFQRCFSKSRERWLPIQRLIHAHRHLRLWIVPYHEDSLATEPASETPRDESRGVSWDGRGKPACVQPAGSGRASGRSGASEQRSGPAASVQNVQWGELGKVSLKSQKHTQGLEIYFHTFFLQVLFDMKLVSSQGSHL